MRLFPKREHVGPSECPIMYRWELLKVSDRWKVSVHHFLPNADDPDPHDHPRSFVTVVLWGGYKDVQPDGTVEVMRPGKVRVREAEHTHRTLVGPRGCWTVVVMAPVRRPWGFWRDGIWYRDRDYKRIFGPSMQCDDR